MEKGWEHGCPHCQNKAKTEQGHWQHLRDAHNEHEGYEAWKLKKKGIEVTTSNSRACPHCPVLSKTEQGHWQHLRDAHNEHEGYEAWKLKKKGIEGSTSNSLTCPHCQVVSKTEQGHWQHLRDAHNEHEGYEAWKLKKKGIEGSTSNSLPCPRCQVVSNNEQGYWQHQRDSHDEGEGYNTWKEGNRKEAKNKKKEVALTERKEICPMEDCGKIFQHIAALAQHTKDFHGVFLIEQDSIFELNPKNDEYASKSLSDFQEEVRHLQEKLSTLNGAQTIELFKEEQDHCHVIAWKGLLLIESILRKIAKKLNFDKPGGTWGNYLSYLKMVGFIQSDLYSTLWDLKMLRNVISHTNDVLVNRSKTEIILQTSQDILLVIENYNQKKESRKQ